MTLPHSRVVVYPKLLPRLPASYAPSLPVHVGYYVGELPVELPFLWAWQPAKGQLPRPAAVPGVQADLSAATGPGWQKEGLRATFDGRHLHIIATRPGYGCLSATVTVNLGETPLLHVHVPKSDAVWLLRVREEGAESAVTLQEHTRQCGSFLYDVRAATGWGGRKQFSLRLFAVDQGKPVTVGALGFLGLRAPVPTFTCERTAWQPHVLTTPAETGDGATKLESRIFFTDRDTVVQRLTIEQATRSATLVLLGQFADGRVQWEESRRTLLLAGRQFHAALAVSRQARWIGVFPTWADWLLGRPQASAASGIWALALDEVKPGEEILVACRFAPGATAAETSARLARAAAHPVQAERALGEREKEWNACFERVPRPLSFDLHLADPRGTTPDAIRRAYYRAWWFFLANTLPPLPENAFPFPQVPCGKASLWGEGAPHARASSQWESFVAMQFLAWVEPETAWAAYEGLLSLVRADGILEGEGLPSRHAQTAWILYQLTGDKERLRRCYPALKRLLLWKASDPRWIYHDARPAGEKHINFVVHALMDMGFARRAAAALGMPDDASFWDDQARALYSEARKWFWEREGGPPFHRFVSGKRYSKNEVASLLGLVLPPELLQEPERRSLLAYFPIRYAPDKPFGIGGIMYPMFNYTLRGAWQNGLHREAATMAEAAMRDVTAAGEFSEVYGDEFPVRPRGVQPSVGGAAHIVDASLWHNGMLLGEGLPRIIAVPHAGGVENLPLFGATVDVRFDEKSERLELRGTGLRRLRLPEGFQAGTLPDGSPCWQRKLPLAGPVALQASSSP